MDLVSVVIPVYNGEKFINECVESMLQQTYQNIEIIFVDDGSQDNTRKKIESWMQKNKNIRYIYQKNKRQGAARNNGLKNALGKYVCFIDCDDYIDKNMIKEMHAYMEKADYDIVLCDYYITHTKEDKQLRSCYYEPFKDNDNVSLKEYLLSDPSPCNKMYKTEFLIKNDFSFLENIIYEDYACIPTLVKHHPKVGYISKPFLFYVQSDNSTTRNQGYKENYIDILKASEYLYESLKDDKEFHDELEYIFIYHLLHNASILFNQFEKYENVYKVSNFIEKNFPKWYNNKYFKKECFKFKVICYLFYKKRIKLINVIRKCKKRYEE